MPIRIHCRDHDLVEFLYDRPVNSPEDAKGTPGEVKMLPEPLAKNLRDEGYGRLTSEISPPEDTSSVAKRFQKVPVVKIKDVDFVYTQRVTCPHNEAGELNEIRKLPEPVAKKLAERGFGKIKESKDDTGERSKSSDSGPDIQSSDGDKKGAVRNRRRRNSVGPSSGSA